MTVGYSCKEELSELTVALTEEAENEVQKRVSKVKCGNLYQYDLRALIMEMSLKRGVSSRNVALCSHVYLKFYYKIGSFSYQQQPRFGNPK